MSDHPIIVFDGFCNLCNGAVSFIIRRDSRQLFRFAPMQGAAACALMDRYEIQSLGYDTFFLVKDGQCFLSTSAALEIARDLDGYWYLFGVFRIVPAPIRDFFYRLLGRHRYRLFGRRASCMVPSPNVAERFLQ